MWLADAQGDVGMTRKRNWHPWITYESDEALSSGDTETLKDVDVDGVIRWRDAICSPSPPDSIDSQRNPPTTSQEYPYGSKSEEDSALAIIK